MPRHPNYFENYRRYIEYRNRVNNYEFTPVEQAVNRRFLDGSSDLDAFGFRPELPGPFNYTPAEYSSHYLQVDLAPGTTSFIDDLTVPRNLLDLPEEFGAYASATPESAALAAGESTAEFGPEVAIPASAVAYLAVTHPGVAKRVVRDVIGQTLLGYGPYTALKAGEKFFTQYGSAQVQPSPPQAGGSPYDWSQDNHGNTQPRPGGLRSG